ncbi:MAG: 30S ribosomal protein S12 methylthiotransferase RimO [Treponema sp.]|jgi:ribosomal protein S12 methylthiotransferase|nr:30S ribosomal protein S12 methylthiotransferase RimO [Treponema sp.]
MKYFLDPFGCVKNQVDGENMMARLNSAGWESAGADLAGADLADVIIVNSCGFIESAKQESINAVLEWRRLYPDKKILLAGCLSQRYAKELPDILTEADAFIGVENPAQIVEAVEKLTASSLPSPSSVDLKIQHPGSFPPGERPLLSLPGSAYVKISDGCNNRCSYCAIPLIRGNLYSREIPDILEECRALLGRGIRELCIIGQDIGAFGTDAQGEPAISKLPELLEAISALKGDFWARLLYIHPDHFPLKILDIMEEDTRRAGRMRILPYFDIPFQHASPKILSAMNRRGNAQIYLELLETIRSRFPSAVIRSTFLLGFPGETDEDFSALLEFQEKAALDWAGCFTYSREEGTQAYNMKKRVSLKTALKRKQIIEEKQIHITEKNMDRFVGRTLDVLTEERLESAGDSGGKDFCLGRLYCQAPDIDGTAVIAAAAVPQMGTFTKCKVIARRGIDLEVKPV